MCIVHYMLTLCTVCIRVTVEAVVMGRDVTNRIETGTLVILFTHLILDAPFEMCEKIVGFSFSKPVNSKPIQVIAFLSIHKVR